MDGHRSLWNLQQSIFLDFSLEIRSPMIPHSIHVRPLSPWPPTFTLTVPFHPDHPLSNNLIAKPINRNNFFTSIENLMHEINSKRSADSENPKIEKILLDKNFKVQLNFYMWMVNDDKAGFQIMSSDWLILWLADALIGWDFNLLWVPIWKP